MKYMAFWVLFGTLALTACEDGAAERLGENIDNAAQDAGNAVEDLCEDVTDRNC